MYQPGQHIVCIKTLPHHRKLAEWGITPVVKGRVYTVRSTFISRRTGNLMIQLVEIINPIPPGSRKEGGYARGLFRPLARLTPEMFNVQREDQPLGELISDDPKSNGW